MFADILAYKQPVTFTGAGELQTLDLQLNDAGPFEILQICDTLTSEFYLNIIEPRRGNYWFNDRLPATCISGTGQEPFELPVSKIVSDSQLLRLDLKNGITADNAGEIIIIGAQLSNQATGAPREIAMRPIGGYYRADYPGEFAAYGVEVNFTANNEVQKLTIPIMNDYNFDTFYFLDNHSSAKPWSFNVDDASRGTSIFATKIPASCVAGTGSKPFILPVTKPYIAGGSIIVNAQNGPFSGVNSGWLVLAGANRWSNEGMTNAG